MWKSFVRGIAASCPCAHVPDALVEELGADSFWLGVSFGSRGRSLGLGPGGAAAGFRHGRTAAHEGDVRRQKPRTSDEAPSHMVMRNLTKRSVFERWLSFSCLLELHSWELAPESRPGPCEHTCVARRHEERRWRQTTRARDVPVTRTIAPGVRLHLLRTDRFTTSYCRVALHRDLGAEATATAILAQVLQSATRRHPSREALGHRLGDLYGAALHVGVGKLGDRQLLVGSLDWPTAHVPRARGLLAEGLELLRDVWSDPPRVRLGGAEALDPDIVRTEQVNHVRALHSMHNNKGRHAMRSCLASICRDEPYGLDAQGREEDVAAADPVTLATLHRRLLATAPLEIFLVGDLGLRDATRAIRKHLLWSDRSPRSRRVPAVGSVRAARSRPRRIVEEDTVTQGKLVLGLRAAIRGGTALGVAAETLAGVLGGGSYGRLFKVVREEHGLCYYASGGLAPGEGADGHPDRRGPRQRGAGPARDPEAHARRWPAATSIPTALEGFRLDVGHRVEALQRQPARHGRLATRSASTLGLDPSPDSLACAGLQCRDAGRGATRRLASSDSTRPSTCSPEEA